MTCRKLLLNFTIGCLNQVDIKRRSLTWYTAPIIAPLSWRWGRIVINHLVNTVLSTKLNWHWKLNLLSMTVRRSFYLLTFGQKSRFQRLQSYSLDCVRQAHCQKHRVQWNFIIVLNHLVNTVQNWAGPGN